ncbi:hypothetical protein TRICI_000602 [Trichomonascus ciferrii]|uniref:Uncharacterized protein n=1 Tax=Trichomonascus ciferrii TaxID=44093 RepID=A0A642VD03_9ASCO|nr:hypothetical protein TRICI_000602 [Trichomonascus ciferrii]
MIPQIALQARTRISNVGKALHKKLDLKNLKLHYPKAQNEQEEPEYINLEELLDDPDAVPTKPYSESTQSLVKRGNPLKEYFSNLKKDQSSNVQTANDQEGKDCVEVTWKRVFLHSLYGDPPNFCHN